MQPDGGPCYDNRRTAPGSQVSGEVTLSVPDSGPSSPVGPALPTGSFWSAPATVLVSVSPTWAVSVAPSAVASTRAGQNS